MYLETFISAHSCVGHYSALALALMEGWVFTDEVRMCLRVTSLSLMGRKSADGKKCREEVLGRAVSHLMGEPRERFTLRGCS